jgi:hypothetical protein
MGLDMYLNAKRFLWHNESELADKLTENFPELGEARVKEVVAEAMYWRKSNAIHKWFVDNVQAGVDDCGNYDVSREQLQSLLAVITEVLNDRKKANTLLPPQSGFFFGSKDIDDWYWQDLQNTKQRLEKLLAHEMPGWWFEYHSSW